MSREPHGSRMSRRQFGTAMVSAIAVAATQGEAIGQPEDLALGTSSEPTTLESSSANLDAARANLTAAVLDATPAAVPHEVLGYSTLASRLRDIHQLLVSKLPAADQIEKDPLLRVLVLDGYKVDLASVPRSSIAVSTRQMERAIDAATEIIEAAARLHAERQSVAERGAVLLLDLIEYVRLEDVHQQSVAAGEYQEPIDETQLESSAENRYKLTVTGARDGQRVLYDQISSVHGPEGDYAKSAAIPYLDSSPQSPNTSIGTNAGPWANKHSFDGVQNNAAFWNGGAAQFRAGQDIDLQWRQASVALGSLQAQVDASADRKAVLDRRLAWLTVDSNLKRLRDQYVMYTLDQKLNNSVDGNGSLNYSERVIRLDRQIAELFARAAEYAYGLEKTIADLLPSPSGLRQLPQSTMALTLEDLRLWLATCRDFIRRVNTLSTRFTFRVSLKSHLGILSSIIGKGSTFLIRTTELPYTSYVRLSAVQVLASDSASQLIVTLRAPDNAVVYGTDGKPHVIAQKTEPVFCSRPCPVSNWWNSDLLGLSGLVNVSPFGSGLDVSGKWRVTLDLRPGSAPLNADSDILLDFSALSYSPNT